MNAKLDKITDSIASLEGKLKDLQDLPSSESFYQMIKNTHHFLDQLCEDQLWKAETEAAAILPLILHEISTSILYVPPDYFPAYPPPSTRGRYIYAISKIMEQVGKWTGPS
eukprot:2112914-Ditylum_brightwellii.AAC.1